MSKALAFVADEGVEKAIVVALREHYDVLYIAEVMGGANDDVILDEANLRGKVLITLDKDFGELVLRDRKSHAGVILCRLQSLPHK